MDYKHLFGPVASRRLGVSLGVDIMPLKVCNLNCVYCECGSTTTLSAERREWVPAAEVIAELSGFLAPSPVLDVVTVTGSGEPTLNTGLGTIVGFLKKNFPRYATALLTNGTLFTLPEVRESAALFDYVLPSLDAVSSTAFKKVNRPHKGLDNKRIIEGLVRFAEEYKGALWLEVFIVPGANDSAEELRLLKNAFAEIGPGRVQLNTLDRPGAVASITPASAERLLEIAEFLKPLPVEILSRQYAAPARLLAGGELESAILATLRRRPSTVEDLTSTSGGLVNEVSSILSRLVKEKKVRTEAVNKRLFYRMAD
ncbi:MAG TPA: radical SAM protein [Chitinivibrionales bacterium]|nr:radical SAM protein [Chitinivibrionales bacterium]